MKWLAKNGYTIARGYKDYLKQSKKADKMLLLQTEEASKREFVAIPYAIDRKKGEMTLQDITRSAINFLSKDLSKGFFLMVEGGGEKLTGPATAMMLQPHFMK